MEKKKIKATKEEEEAAAEKLFINISTQHSISHLHFYNFKHSVYAHVHACDIVIRVFFVILVAFTYFLFPCHAV